MALPIILLAFANDLQDRDRLLMELPKEQQELTDTLNKHFDIELLPQATLENIQDAFNRKGERIRIFHFGGHANASQIELAHNRDGHKTAYVKGVAAFIGRQAAVRLVFLNGCSTSKQVRYFLDAGVEALIATTAPVRDDFARRFASFFYRAWVQGSGEKLMLEAFEEAKDLTRAEFREPEQIFTPGFAWQVGSVGFPYELHTRNSEGKKRCYADLKGNWQELGPVHPKVYLKCGRRKQNEAFKTALCTRLDGEEVRSPLICLIHGDEAEMPLMLSERFYCFSIEEAHKKLNLGLNKSEVRMIEVEMPVKEDYQDEKARYLLRENFKLELDMQQIQPDQIQDLKSTDILRHLGNHFRVLVFHHLLYASEWDEKRGPAFLKWYLEDFWNINLLDQQPQVILLFTLEYTPRKGLLARLGKRPQYDKDFPPQIANILNRLISVPRKDVKTWNDKYAREETPQLTEQIFGKKQKLPMQDIQPALRQATKKRNA